MNKQDKELWNEFLQKYDKVYSKDEMQFRFQIFLKNLRLLQDEPIFQSPDGKTLLGASMKSSRPPKRYKKGIN